MINKTQSFIKGYFKRYKKLDKFSARFKIVTFLIGLFIISIFYNLFKLMVFQSEIYQQKAASQQLKITVIPANRGTIYDINGEKLVQSAAAWIVELKPQTLSANYSDSEHEEICHTIAEILGVSYENVLKRSRMNSTSAMITKKADKDQKDKLNAYIYRDVYQYYETVKDKDGKAKKEERLFFTEKVMAGEYPELTIKKNKDKIKVLCGEHVLKHIEKYKYIKGVSLLNDTNRYYYHDDPIAVNVIGYTNFDNVGSLGIESYYNDQLKGIDGKNLTAKNSMGGEMPFDFNDSKQKPVNGNDITLTIDANIQTMLEKYLGQAVIDNDVQNHAAGIIMNVNTGAILAMATMPDYDPADYQTITDPVALKKISEIEDPDEKKKARIEAQQEQWRNKAVNDAYEPGSVFKPITMSSALEEGVTSLDENFVCKGYLLVGKRRIKCANRSGHGHETLTQAMMNSCNPVLMELGLRLKVDKFSEYFKSYGLTAATGIDLPGESSGMYHHREDMTELDLAECSFGQSMTVTPIQMITAFSAVINGGYLLRPYMVDSITDPNGNIVLSKQKFVKRQVISEETSAKMRNILEATANKGGTAHNVYLAGYRIGGKTGTSEKIAKQAILKDNKRLYVASFCGIAPIDNPEVAVLVMLDEPQGKKHSGGSIAAPVVRGIFSELLPYLGVDPVYSEEEAAYRDMFVPSVVGQNKDDAVSTLKGKGFETRIIGDGDTITGQIPAGGRTAPNSCTVVLTTESGGEVPTTIVPYLVGLSASKVAYAVKNKNLNIRYSGTGFTSAGGISIKQEIPAGSEVEEGTVVTVEFAVDGIND